MHGLGYVGLTAAVHFARADWQVIGYDPDTKTVEALNQGVPRAREFLAYLNGDVTHYVTNGFLSATHTFTDTATCPVHLVAVPTERDGRPDATIITQVLRALAAQIVDGGTILVESTLPPGVIDDLLPSLPGAGQRWHLAVCPRRDWFADPSKNLKSLPRVVGGLTPACTDAACQILSAVSDTLMPTDYQTAELTKSLENALLHQQIMLVHQLAWAFPDRRVADAVALAGTHWRLTPLHLGCGTGGRCVPLGSEYLWQASKGRLTMAGNALAWDQQHRRLIADMLHRTAPLGTTIGIYGIAYRPEFRDAGRSPGVDIAKMLKAAGRLVFVHDPYFSTDELRLLTGCQPMGKWGGESRGAVLLATPHDEYQTMPEHFKYDTLKVIVDSQGTWRGYRSRFQEAQVDYRVIGEPGWLA